MPDVTITNWFGDIVSHPRIVVDAHTVDDIIHILNNPGKYPSPVRAIGSNHSTTACGTSEGGTVIRIKMNRILNITADSLTVEAGPST
jgi:FAD/FMN-containing dehydrogenase